MKSKFQLRRASNENLKVVEPGEGATGNTGRLTPLEQDAAEWYTPPDGVAHNFLCDSAGSAEQSRTWLILHRPITPLEMYRLDWSQLIRLVYRCKFWYEETKADELALVRPREEHERTLMKDLEKLSQRLEVFGMVRFSCLKKVCDDVSSIEGPNGLGSTSKHDFESIFGNALIRFDISIQPEHLEVLCVSGAERKNRIKRKDQVKLTGIFLD